jgi:hypothetical protein
MAVSSVDRSCIPCDPSRSSSRRAWRQPLRCSPGLLVVPAFSAYSASSAADIAENNSGSLSETIECEILLRADSERWLNGRSGRNSWRTWTCWEGLVSVRSRLPNLDRQGQPQSTRMRHSSTLSCRTCRFGPVFHLQLRETSAHICVGYSFLFYLNSRASTSKLQAERSCIDEVGGERAPGSSLGGSGCRLCG